MKFKSLYKLDIDGNMLGWRIWTEDNIVYTRHGRLDGQIQEDSYEVLEGTNIGKSNERDIFDQAEFEAEAKWKKQIKYRGYFETEAGARNAGDTTYFGALKPMKAQRWKDHKHKLSYPLYTQPKLNGLRCIAVRDSEGTIRLYRSGGQEVKQFKHILEGLQEVMEPNEIFDGELYCHGMPLNLISGIVRADVNIKDTAVLYQIEYHVFDAPKIHKSGIDSSFTSRYSVLYFRFMLNHAYGIKLVETNIAISEEEAEYFYKKYISDGYEGMMYRSIKMTYKPGKRSYEIQKRKEFMEDDFEILYAQEGKGRAKGMAISFKCGRYSDEVGERVIFDVPMNGTTSYLIDLWNKHEMWKGKWLQTRFLNYTVYGKPEIPKGLQIRDKKGED